MVSPISYIGTVRISLHTVSVKYFVLPAHPISCWKTSIKVQRVTSVEVHSRKMHTGFIFATDTSARIGSLDCLCADKLSFCHLFHRFSVTMEPLYAFKASKHLLKIEVAVIKTLMTDSGSKSSKLQTEIIDSKLIRRKETKKGGAQGLLP